jgi:hypothetical protein
VQSQEQDEQTVATRTIEGAAAGAAAGADAAIAGLMRADAEPLAHGVDLHPARQPSCDARPAVDRALAKLRAHKPELVLLAVALGCVITFASWLDGQLRPALDARERNELASEDLRERFEPCLPNAARSPATWCGAVRIPPPPPVPVTPIPLIAGAPAAFCTANGGPSC